MKKLVSIIVFSIAFCLCLSADVVSREQAESVARRFFFGEYATKISSDELVLVLEGRASGNGTKSLSNDNFEFIDPAYYAYNRSGGGFVIVSGDDTVDPIIGYSADGAVNPDDMPPALSWWLDGIKKTIDSKRETKSVASYETVLKWKSATKAYTGEGSYYSSVGGKQLDTPQWNQGTPFNDKVPTGCPCGCVATAMTELMRFYSWPSEPKDVTIPKYTDSHSNVIAARNLTDRVYDWEKMPLTISGCQYASSAVRNNIADLLADVGASVKMNYASGGSGAHSERIVYSLGEYFHYNKKARIEYRDNYSEREWVDMMVKSIDEGHPLLTSGTSESGGGHQFIVDGYDANHLMRFNFGWGTSYNGYWAVGMNEYALCFSAIFDEYPDIAGDTVFDEPTIHFEEYSTYKGIELSSGMVAKGSSFTMRCGGFIANGPEDFSGYMRLAIVNKDGTDTTGIGSASSYSQSIGYYGYKSSISGSISRDISLGDHIILQTALSTSGPWSQVRPIANGILVGEYPCVPYAFIDLPETCNIGDEFELRLKNSPYIWYDKTKWYVLEPGTQESVLVNVFTQGALNDGHRPSYKFSKAGIYTVRVTVSGQETITARIEVK